jgi:hypothetical protein
MLITNSLAEVVLGPVNIALCGSFVDIAGCKQRLIEIEEIKCCQHGVSKVSPGLPFQWRKGKCIKNACRNARVGGIRKRVRRSKTPKIEGRWIGICHTTRNRFQLLMSVNLPRRVELLLIFKSGRGYAEKEESKFVERR